MRSNIEGFDGYYITSCGKVWSYKSNKFIAINRGKGGYLQVSMYDNNGKLRTKQIHRLVALAYIPNPDNLRTVDHIDNNKEHNYINNLQWMTDKDNIVKERGKKIRCIELNMEFKSQTEAAKYFNCCHQNISNCLRGKAKTACGYHWEVVQ